MEKMTEHFKNRFVNGKENGLEPNLPSSLNVELNSSCNHMCRFCGVHGPDKPFYRSPVVMEKEKAKSIIRNALEQGIGRSEVGFYMQGEPLLYTGLADIIEYTKNMGVPYTFITTNGVLCTPERMAELINAGLDSIRFSVNAGTRESYKWIHGKDDFDKVYNNILWLSEHRSNFDHDINVSMSCVVSKRIIDEIDLIKKTFDPIVDEILFMPVMGVETLSEENCKELRLPDEMYGAEHNIFCPIPFNTMYITADCKVVMCCQAPLRGVSIADICGEEYDFEEIWKSEQYREIRKAQISRELNDTICEKCPAITGGVLKFSVDNYVGKVRAD